MTPADLDALLTTRSESEQVEFKATKGAFPFEELVNDCVALSNEDGGLMILGVTDPTPRLAPPHAHERPSDRR